MKYISDAAYPKWIFYFFFLKNLFLIKIPILQTICVDFYQNSIFCLPSLRFNYGFHNFWHSINWLLSFSDRSCVSNMVECILPHVHGPLVTCVLFTSLYILLCKFKSTCKFSFYGHAIMTLRRVTIFYTRQNRPRFTASKMSDFVSVTSIYG